MQQSEDLSARKPAEKVGDELPKKAELQKIEKHFYVFPSETGNGIPAVVSDF